MSGPKSNPLVHKAPEYPESYLQTGIRIVRNDDIIIIKATSAERVQVFGSDIGSKTLNPEMSISGYLRNLQPCCSGILKKKLADHRRVSIGFIGRVISQFQPHAYQQVSESKITIITNLVSSKENREIHGRVTGFLLKHYPGSPVPVFAKAELFFCSDL